MSYRFADSLRASCQSFIPKINLRISASSWFYYRNLSWCTVTWSSNSLPDINVTRLRIVHSVTRHTCKLISLQIGWIKWLWSESATSVFQVCKPEPQHTTPTAFTIGFLSVHYYITVVVLLVFLVNSFLLQNVSYNFEEMRQKV